MSKSVFQKIIDREIPATIVFGDDLVLAFRDATEGAAYEWLSGRIMHIDLATGKILGSMESPGHWLTVSPNGDIFAASLTGNVFRWTPGWPEKH